MAIQDWDCIWTQEDSLSTKNSSIISSSSLKQHCKQPSAIEGLDEK